MEQEIYLRTDELVESIKGLEMFLYNIRKVKKDLYFWKWAIIALHNSVQGFMVCALRGTNGLAVLTPECASAWLDAHINRNETPYPKEKLDEFLNLYKKIKGNSYMLQYIHSQKFIPRGQEGRSIRKLNEIRNEFIHFTPKGWSLEVSGLPQICGDILAIIRFLVNSSGNIYFCTHHDKFKKRFDIVFSKAMILIKELK